MISATSERLIREVIQGRDSQVTADAKESKHIPTPYDVDHS